MNLKQFYRYVFGFILSVFFLTGCGNDSQGDSNTTSEVTPSPTPSIAPSPTPSVAPSPTPSVAPSPTPSVAPRSTPSVAPSPTPTQQNNLKIYLNSTEKIAGYEVHLKFTNDTPNHVNIDNAFLVTTGRTVNNLGADINSSTKEIKFGAFTFGTQEGVSGEFDVLTFKTKDSKSQISITKKSCVDKDANDIFCDIEIK